MDLLVLFGIMALLVCIVCGDLKRAHAKERAIARRWARWIARRRVELRRRGEKLTSDALRESDAAFDERRFLERVRHAYFAVHEARLTGDVAPARAFVSDGVFERLAHSVEEERLLGVRRELRDIVVEDLQLALLRSGAEFDELTVAIQAKARVHRVRLAGGSALRADEEDAHSSDAGGFWTFLRRRGAKTRPGPGLLEGRCPNCGTPVALRHTASCVSCQAKLRSGAHDWVLSGITHPSSWIPRAAARIPGVPELLEDDPGFSVQHLEDRVGVIFWRWLLAGREGRASRLETVADPAFCAGFPSAGAGSGGGLADVEIEDVSISAVLEADGWHRAFVSVRWHGWRREAPDEPVGDRTVFVLARRAGARTDTDDVISSAHCPGCGAPDVEARGAQCAFCGLVLNDGTSQWILLEAAPTRSERGRELLRDLEEAANAWRHPKPDVSGLHRGAFPLLLRVLGDDGWLTPEAASAVASLDGRDEPYTPLEALTQEEIQASLRVIVDLALAHGGVGARRRDILIEFAEGVGLTSLDVRMLIDQREREWDGRAEAERQEAAKRERARERREWAALVREDEQRES